MSLCRALELDGQAERRIKIIYLDAAVPPEDEHRLIIHVVETEHDTGVGTDKARSALPSQGVSRRLVSFRIITSSIHILSFLVFSLRHHSLHCRPLNTDLKQKARTRPRWPLLSKSLLSSKRNLNGLRASRSTPPSSRRLTRSKSVRCGKFCTMFLFDGLGRLWYRSYFVTPPQTAACYPSR